MAKRILLTGATDGIGLETAKRLGALGHQVLLHGRDASKLDSIQQLLNSTSAEVLSETYRADLSHMDEVEALAKAISDEHGSIDVLINNAGVFATSNPVTPDGLDLRFVVNSIAPYLLTQRLLPLMNKTGRIINLSSAAQAPVDISALKGNRRLSDNEAYAQSKLALTMWSRHLAMAVGENGPTIVAVNPGSFLGSKMVKEAYGLAGKDLGIGAEILTRAALSDEFASASGLYYDNDNERFASPHADALDPAKTAALVEVIETILVMIK